MTNRYWQECVTEKKTYNGHKIYKDNVTNKWVVRFRWGEDLGEDVNKFDTLKEAKSFIDRVVIPQREDHSVMEKIATNYTGQHYIKSVEKPSSRNIRWVRDIIYVSNHGKGKCYWYTEERIAMISAIMGEGVIVHGAREWHTR